jgi:hypothetical protein
MEMQVARRQAEPGDQCVPKQELGNEELAQQSNGITSHNRSRELHCDCSAS